MKILHLIPSLDPRGGGPAEGVRELASELTSRGHEIEVVSLDCPSLDFIKRFPVTVHALGPSVGAYRFNGRLTRWLKTFARNYDVVVVNGIWQFHSFAAWMSLKKSKTPYVLFTHGMLDPWFKRAYPLKHLKKWLYWPWAEYRVLRDAAAVIFTCEEERRLARQSFCLYRCNEEVTAYGTKTPPPDPGRLLATSFIKKHGLEGKRILLFLSRIHEKKGCDLLIEAFAGASKEDSALHLVMAGPDKSGLMPMLKDRVDALGLSNRVTWTGMLQGSDKWGAFHAAEVFCLPSHQENFGIVVAEALACGKPVLISNKINIWREIEEDAAGIVRDDTLEGTASALSAWLNLPPIDKVRMKGAAVKSFEARFHISRVADRFLEIVSAHIRSKIIEGTKVGGAYDVTGS